MGKFILFAVVQFLLWFSLIYFIVFVYKVNKALLLEQRITRFSINSISDRPLSFFDRAMIKYNNFISGFSKILAKSKLINIYSKRYEKYISTSKVSITSTDIVVTKIMISLGTVIITIISDVLRLHPVSFIQIIFALLVGFIVPDIFLEISYKRKEKRLENELLKAVLIMSNAFKSGRSIMQAIDIVSKELEGPVSEEFKRMYIDLSYGLDLEVVFERFSSRIKLEETRYMASSLVILNKTGGNVIKVFDSIEKNFFERKKLNDELKSVTALSNFVFRILIVIPFIIFGMIYILNPSYFAPFITTGIGNVLIGIILLIYILYIVIVKKLIRIKE